MASSNYGFPPPEPLRVSGNDTAGNWERFYEQWQHYLVAMDLTDSAENKKVAVFLTCIGTEAFEVYRNFQFAPDQVGKLDAIVKAFKDYCVGAMNVTYERYQFHKRHQDLHERFDNFVGDLRRLAKNCAFGDVSDSMIRDRIVVGIRDDAIRQKLLQIPDLTLTRAINLCRTSELASRQFKEMSLTDEAAAVHAVAKPKSRKFQPPAKQQQNNADDGNCYFCGHQHAKSQCPARGKTCRACGKKNHFDYVCKSSQKNSSTARKNSTSGSSTSGRRQQKQVCDVTEDFSDELMTLFTDDGRSSGELKTIAGRRERYYARMSVSG